jgi:SAM-dependent methyltransferase
MTVAGTVTVVRFNWPKYAAVAALLAGAAAARRAGAPPVVGAALGLSGALGLVWSVTSLVATWWVYDHRRVYDRLALGLGDAGAWASVHAGFDEATPRLVRALRSEPVAVVELSVPARPSLRRARAGGRAAPAGARPATTGALPLASSSLDSVFVTFAAHEIRDRAGQRALFAELRRALRPGGRLVVTEHARDLANASVYGPGALHFQRAAVWTDRAAEAGFEPLGGVGVTPFVRRMAWRR